MRIGLVLCGGGAKGAYQIGCWKALKEVGMDKFAVVSGTSVGALNGALIAMGDYQQAEKIWMELTEKHVLLTTEARKLLVKFVFGVMLILGTLFYHIKMIFVLFAVPVFFTVYVIWLFMHPHGMPAFGPLEMWFFDVMTIGGLLFLWWNAFYLFQDYYQTSTYSFGRIFVRTFIPKLAVLLGRWLPIGINYPLLNLIKSNLNTKQLRESDITLYCTVSVATKYRDPYQIRMRETDKSRERRSEYYQMVSRGSSAIPPIGGSQYGPPPEPIREVDLGAIPEAVSGWLPHVINVTALESDEEIWVFRSVLSASINADFCLRPYESPYNSSC